MNCWRNTATRRAATAGIHAKEPHDDCSNRTPDSQRCETYSTEENRPGFNPDRLSIPAHPIPLVPVEILLPIRAGNQEAQGHLLVCGQCCASGAANLEQ